MKPPQRPELAEDFKARELRTSTIDRAWIKNEHSCRDEFQEQGQYAAWRRYEAAKSGVSIIDDGKYLPPPPPKPAPAAAAPISRPAVIAPAVTTPATKVTTPPAAPIAVAPAAATKTEQTSAEKPVPPKGSALTSAVGFATGPDGKGVKIMLYAANGDQSQVVADVHGGTYTRPQIVARTQKPVIRAEIESELGRAAMLTNITWSSHSELAPVRSLKRHEELIAGDSK